MDRRQTAGKNTAGASLLCRIFVFLLAMKQQNGDRVRTARLYYHSLTYQAHLERKKQAFKDRPQCRKPLCLGWLFVFEIIWQPSSIGQLQL